MAETRVVLDTNTFVAAGFNKHSASARIVERIRQGQARMVWNEATLDEIRFILEKIPPLSWSSFEPLFREEDRFERPVEPDRYPFVSDPADRKFIALAEAAGAVLVTNDHHLLEHRDHVSVLITTPAEFMA